MRSQKLAFNAASGPATPSLRRLASRMNTSDNTKSKTTFSKQHKIPPHSMSLSLFLIGDAQMSTLLYLRHGGSLVKALETYYAYDAIVI